MRISWRCALCPKIALTHQFVIPGSKPTLLTPSDWYVMGGDAYCPRHANDGRHIAEASTASGASGLFGRSA